MSPDKGVDIKRCSYLAFNDFVQFYGAHSRAMLRSRTTIVWPFFVYSKMAMFQATN